MLTSGVCPQMYPAMRDAKAAVRWVRANAEQYNAAPEYITAIGGSAGACSVVGLATTTESDYKEELTSAEDPTLASTNLEERSSIATGLVQWGGEYVPLFTRLRDPQNRSRYTSANAPLSTYHGSMDGVISIAEEDGLIAGCECQQPSNGLPRSRRHGWDRQMSDTERCRQTRVQACCTSSTS